MQIRRYGRLVACLVAPVATLASLVLLAQGAVGLGLVPWLSGTANDAPAAAVDRCEWDFGRVTAGPVLQTRFAVGNRGDRRLVLRQKSRSCECVAFSQPEVVVPPGGRRELGVSLDTRGVSGAVEMELTYWTNDPLLPTITFKALAEIVAQSSGQRTVAPRPIPAAAR